MYDSEISRKKPALITIMLDRSTSMNDHFCGQKGESSKADGVADAVNRVIHNIVIKSTKGEIINHYFDVAVLGYGSSVACALSGTLSGKQIISVKELGENPLRIDERKQTISDGAGGPTTKDVRMPIWVEPLATGGTPMLEAFTQVKKILEPWISQHPESFPPIVINITDGESTDGDPREIANEIKKLQTSDGSVLIMNAHLSSSKACLIEFPNRPDELPDNYAKMLFEMSSILPPKMLASVQAENKSVKEGGRGFVFNADLVSLITFLDIGTRPSGLR